MNKREAMKGIAQNMVMLSNTIPNLEAVKGLRIAAQLLMEASDSMCGTGVYGCLGGDPCTIHKLPEPEKTENLKPVKLEYMRLGCAGFTMVATVEQAQRLAIGMFQGDTARPTLISKDDTVLWDIATEGAIDELERLTGQDAAG